jgi:hypothetical protein
MTTFFASLRRISAHVGCFAVITAGAALGLVGCPGPETIDLSTIPADVRPDYAVFAERCSKCHSLARPLNSGIEDDDYWAMYVARMRRQPGSGISIDDSKVILRFLHYYSLEQQRKRNAKERSRQREIEKIPPVQPAEARPGDAGAGHTG